MTKRPNPIDLVAVLTIIKARLAEGAAIADAALMRAQAGDHGQALTRALDCEEPAREAIILLNAASVVARKR
mgnify:CR=1 FL=1